MSKRRVKRKRSKALVLMLLPALIFIGFLGWLVCALEPPKKNTTKGYQTPYAKNRNDGVTFMPAAYEKQTEVETH